MLARRARTREELVRKLRRKGFAAGEIERVLEDLRVRGLLDDLATAAAIARSRSARGIGRRRIASELRGKGVDPEAVAESLATIDAATERESLEKALARKRRTLSHGLTPAERSKKLFDHLVRRGFSPEAVLEALRQKGEPSDDPE